MTAQSAISACEGAAVEQLARERVEPDRDAGVAGAGAGGSCGPAFLDRERAPRAGRRGRRGARSSTATRSRIRRWMVSVTSQTLTFMPATTRSPASQKAMNSRVAGSPRKTTRSQSRAKPAYSMPTSYWSEKKYGSAVVGGRPAEHGAGGGRALVQRVGPVLDADALAVEAGAGRWRRRRRRTRRRRSVCRCSSTRMPLSTAMPAWRGELGARLHADADDHEVAVERRARRSVRTRSTAPSPSNASTPVPSSIRTPWSAWMSR